MVSKADANRYIITEAVIDHLFNKALPNLKSDEKKMAKSIGDEIKKIIGKKTAGHVLTDSELKAEVMKRVNKIEVNGMNDFLKALQQITRTMERTEGKTSKAYVNTIDSGLNKAMLSLPNELLKGIKDQNREISKLTKEVAKLNKKNDAHQTIYVRLKNAAYELAQELKQEKEFSKMALEESEERKKEHAKLQKAREHDGEIYAKSVKDLVDTIDKQTKEIDDLTIKLIQNGEKIQSANRKISDYKSKFEDFKKLAATNERTIKKKDKLINEIAEDFGRIALNTFIQGKGLKANKSSAEYTLAAGILASARKGGSVSNKKIEQLVGNMIPNFTSPDGTPKSSGGKGDNFKIIQQLQKFEKSVIKSMNLPDPTSDLMKSAVLLLGSMNPAIGAILAAILAIKGNLPYGFVTSGISALGAGAMALGGKVINAGKRLLAPSNTPRSAKDMAFLEARIRDKYIDGRDPKTEKGARRIAQGNRYLKIVRAANEDRRNFRKSAILGTLGKKIPGFGILAGVGSSFGHFLRGDTLGGLGELTSGILGGALPGLGTVLSTGLDAWLGNREISAVRRAKSPVGKLFQKGALWTKNASSTAGQWVADKSAAALNAVKQSSTVTKAITRLSNMMKGIGTAVKGIMTISKAKLLAVLGIVAAVGILAMWVKDKFFKDKGFATKEDHVRAAELWKKKQSGEALTKEEETELESIKQRVKNRAKDERKKLKAAKTKGLTGGPGADMRAENEAWEAVLSGGHSIYLGHSSVDASQLLPESTFTSKRANEIEAEMARRTGAYEKLRDKKNYWRVDTAQFAKTNQNVSGGTNYHDVLYVEKGVQDSLANAVDKYGLSAGFKITSGTKSKGSIHGTHTGRQVDIAYENGSPTREQLKRDRAALERQKAAGELTGYLWEGDHWHLNYGKANSKSDSLSVPARKAAEETAKKVSEPIQTAANGMREDLWKRAMGEGNSKLDKTRNLLFSATDITGSLGVWGITRLNTAGGI